MADPKKTILVIDDEPDLVNILREELEGRYSIITATNGKEGVIAARKSSPDLIISDINMPELDGLTMLNELRSGGFKNPIIFMTGYSSTEKIRAAWQLGAFDFLEKPVNFTLLHDSITIALEFGVGFNTNRNDQFKTTRTASGEKIESVTLNIESQLLELCKAKAAAQKISLGEFIEKQLKASVN